MSILEKLPVSKFYCVILTDLGIRVTDGGLYITGPKGFLGIHYALPASVLAPQNAEYFSSGEKMFALFAQVIPTLLAVAAPAVLGGVFFKELGEFFKNTMKDAVALEVVTALTVTSIVATSILSGMIINFLVPNLVASIANACNKNSDTKRVGHWSFDTINQSHWNVYLGKPHSPELLAKIKAGMQFKVNINGDKGNVNVKAKGKIDENKVSFKWEIFEDSDSISLSV